MLYMFQAVPPSIIRSSNCPYRFDKYTKLYVQFELLMMDGGTA
jgi:hypothetical protein